MVLPDDINTLTICNMQYIIMISMFQIIPSRGVSIAGFSDVKQNITGSGPGGESPWTARDPEKI